MQNILIIEDDSTIRSELKILLQKHGYNSIITTDFENVVDFAIEVVPHLILLDLNLPLYDGYHICREIRKKSRVPIIVVTSRNSDIDELMSMNLGADDFITKPYNTQILLARISAVISRSAMGSESNLQTLGSLTLDIGKSIITSSGKSIDVTKNEQRILSMLIKKEGEIVCRDDIMNELWQSNEFVDDNTLTVNINRLRYKLTQIGKPDMLKTKRGQGYLLWE